MLFAHHVRPVFIVALACIFFFVFWSYSSTPSSAYLTSARPPSSWTFNSSIHSRIHTLNKEQCQSSFGDLLESVSAAAKRRGSHPIQLNDLDIEQGRCMLRALLFEGELFVIDAGTPEKCYVPNYRERVLAILQLINRALTSAPELVPNVEFSMSLDDLPLRSRPNGVHWALTRQDSDEYNDIWLMPDYGYWSWNFAQIPSYQAVRQQMILMEKGQSWSQKLDKAVWRGKVNANAEVRAKLLEAAKGKSWSDIHDVDVGEGVTPDFISLADHCRYKFTIQTEGTSYSGRLKYLQLCRGVVVSQRPVWQEIHTHLLTSNGPGQNFVEIQDGWVDLSEKIEYYLANPTTASQIADRSYEMFSSRHLTPAAVSCYWRYLFETWAALQGFDPSLYATDATGNTILRAVPFAKFAVTWPQNPAEIL